MSESYQRNATSGAEPNQPTQVPKQQATEGVSEKANERPDVSGDKDAADLPPAPDSEYPEQKHAGAVGYGPNYAEARGRVTMGERIEGLKEEIKGKITRKPDLVQEGHDIWTGEAKRRKVDEENNPQNATGAFANAPDDKKGEEKKDEDADGDKKMKDDESSQQQQQPQSGAQEHMDAEERRNDQRAEEGQGETSGQMKQATNEELQQSDRKAEEKVESERNEGDKAEMPQ